MTDINYLRKHAGLAPLPTQTDEQLEESIYSTLKALLATVGQKGSKAGKDAAEKAKKLPATIKALYKETESKAALRLMYKKFTVMLTTLDAIDTGTKDLQPKDQDIAKEIELFRRLIARTIDSLQARAGLSVAVEESFQPEEFDKLFEQFLTETKQGWFIVTKQGNALFGPFANKRRAEEFDSKIKVDARRSGIDDDIGVSIEFGHEDGEGFGAKFVKDAEPELEPA